MSFLPPATGRHALPKGLSWLSSNLVLELTPGHCGEARLSCWCGHCWVALDGLPLWALRRRAQLGIYQEVVLKSRATRPRACLPGARPSVGRDLVTMRHRHVDWASPAASGGEASSSAGRTSLRMGEMSVLWSRRMRRAGSRISLLVFVFGKIVSQMFPVLGTIVANSGNLLLQSVFSFYQSAFTDL